MVFDTIVLVIIVLSVILGYKRGFVKTISSLLGFVISIFVSKLIFPYVSNWIEKSAIGETLNKSISDKFQNTPAEQIPFLSSGNILSDVNLNPVTNFIIFVITLLAVLVITLVAVNVIVKALNLVTKLPVISFANHTLGIIAGLIMGTIFVLIIWWVILVVNSQSPWLEGSAAAQLISENQIFLEMIF